MRRHSHGNPRRRQGWRAPDGLRRLLARASSIAIAPIDYDEAATLYRACRRGGETVRKLIDCLVTATAIRANVPVLHADSDFHVLARHTAFQLDYE